MQNKTKKRQPATGCHIAVLPQAVMLITSDGHNIVLTPQALLSLQKSQKLTQAAQIASMKR